MDIALYAVAGGVVVVDGIALYNRLVGRKNQVENAHGSVDAMLEATVKRYAAHERETLTRLTSLRARAVQGGGRADEDRGLFRA